MTANVSILEIIHVYYTWECWRVAKLSASGFSIQLPGFPLPLSIASFGLPASDSTTHEASSQVGVTGTVTTFAHYGPDCCSDQRPLRISNWLWGPEESRPHYQSLRFGAGASLCTCWFRHPELVFVACDVCISSCCHPDNRVACLASI